MVRRCDAGSLLVYLPFFGLAEVRWNAELCHASDLGSYDDERVGRVQYQPLHIGKDKEVSAAPCPASPFTEVPVTDGAE